MMQYIGEYGTLPWYTRNVHTTDDHTPYQYTAFNLDHTSVWRGITASIPRANAAVAHLHTEYSLSLRRHWPVTRLQLFAIRGSAISIYSVSFEKKSEFILTLKQEIQRVIVVGYSWFFTWNWISRSSTDIHISHVWMSTQTGRKSTKVLPLYPGFVDCRDFFRIISERYHHRHNMIHST